MGSVTAYETMAGKRYCVRYRKPDLSQTDNRGFRTKCEAELFLAATEVRKATGEFIDATASRISIDEMGGPWLRAQSHLKPSSYAVIEVVGGSTFGRRGGIAFSVRSGTTRCRHG